MAERIFENIAFAKLQQLNRTSCLEIVLLRLSQIPNLSGFVCGFILIPLVNDLLPREFCFCIADELPFLYHLKAHLLINSMFNPKI